VLGLLRAQLAATIEGVDAFAVLVSRYDHSLVGLLWRWRRRELAADIGLVASNHPDLQPLVEGFGVPWQHIPVTDGHEDEAEQRLLALLAGRFDLVVLARYMQILSGELLRALDIPAINIHDSAGVLLDDRSGLEFGGEVVGRRADELDAALDRSPVGAGAGERG